MEEKFFADSMEALRPVAQVPRSLSPLPPISDPAEKVAVPVKDMGKSSSLIRGFLRRGFLNPSSVVQITLVVREGESSPGSHTTIKGSDFRVNGLTQSQKWPLGFGPYWEMVA
jgi:hypothetical protein